MSLLVGNHPSSVLTLQRGINMENNKTTILVSELNLSISKVITNQETNSLFDISNFSAEITKIKTTEQNEKNNVIEAQSKVETRLAEVISLKNDLDNVDKLNKKIETALSVPDTIRKIVSKVLKQLVNFKVVELPPYPELIRSKLPSSIELDDIFSLVSDAINLGSDISSLIIKAYVRSIAMEEIAKLKSNISTLSEEQIDRLEELVKEIHYEDDEFGKKLIGLGVSTADILCSCATFTLKWIDEKGFDAHLKGLGAIGSGLGVISNGVKFHEARKNVEIAQKWAEDFDNWILNQDPTAKDRAEAFKDAMIEHDRELGIFHEKLTEPTKEQKKLAKALKNQDQAAIENRDNTIATVLANRLERQQNEIERLKQKINNNELTMESVLARLLKFKSEEWINEQPNDDALLSTYIDYHSVLDPTIKNAMAQMVSKKQEIQESFLKEQRLEKGISLLSSNVMFAVSATFAIIGLVATPVVGAALVLSILGGASAAVGIGLLGYGIYRAYQLQPNSTAAFLRGNTLLLAYYNVRSAIYELKESIKEYVATKCQADRDRATVDVNNFATDKLGTNQEPQVEDISVIKDAEEKNIEQKQEIVEDQVKEAAKVNEWKQKADELSKKLEDLAWKDFADAADLKIPVKGPGSDLEFFNSILEDGEDIDPNQLREIKQNIRLHSFDTLETFNDLLANCDFDMLSPATKELLKDQLGINVKTLKKNIQEDPEAVKKALLRYFFMDDSSYAKFIKKQTLVKNLHTPQA